MELRLEASAYRAAPKHYKFPNVVSSAKTSTIQGSQCTNTVLSHLHLAV